MTKVITCPDCNGRGTIDRHEVREVTVPDTPVCTLAEERCQRCGGAGSTMVPMTKADRFRAMTDDELVTVIEELLPKLMEAGDNTLAQAICDYRGVCEGDDVCTVARHRDCIRRYLNRPAEDV